MQKRKGFFSLSLTHFVMLSFLSASHFSRILPLFSFDSYSPTVSPYLYLIFSLQFCFVLSFFSFCFYSLHYFLSSVHSFLLKCTPGVALPFLLPFFLSAIFHFPLVSIVYFSFPLFPPSQVLPPTNPSIHLFFHPSIHHPILHSIHPSHSRFLVLLNTADFLWRNANLISVSRFPKSFYLNPFRK